LSQVYYSYSSSNEHALRDINLSIQKNTTVGFIGTSGSGKTTLIDIILGLLSPQSGGIKIDGRNIQTNLRGWQNKIGYVPQSIFLIDASLRQNIAFGIDSEKINEAQVQSAAKFAQLDEFVEKLPDGLDTIVGERGVRLSGGQKQRIGIARALYHNPDIIVLDEATSALDNATERDVMRPINQLKNKTILIIAHRLDSIRNCDTVFRLENGVIVEQIDPIDL
jgi:ABC-type multidrug transport system fused ATPase/permease subunit